MDHSRSVKLKILLTFHSNLFSTKIAFCLFSWTPSQSYRRTAITAWRFSAAVEIAPIPMWPPPKPSENMQSATQSLLVSKLSTDVRKLQRPLLYSIDRWERSGPGWSPGLLWVTHWTGYLSIPHPIRPIVFQPTWIGTQWWQPALMPKTSEWSFREHCERPKHPFANVFVEAFQQERVEQNLQFMTALILVIHKARDIK